MKFRKDYEKSTSFCDQGLNKVGTLIEVEVFSNYADIKKGIHQLLIGHIDENGSGISDWQSLPSNSIVRRYKRILDLEKQNFSFDIEKFKNGLYYLLRQVEPRDEYVNNMNNIYKWIDSVLGNKNGIT